MSTSSDKKLAHSFFVPYLKKFKLSIACALFFSLGLALSTAAMAALIGPILQILSQDSSHHAPVDINILFGNTFGPVMKFFFNQNQIDAASMIAILPSLLLGIGIMRVSSLVGQWYLFERVGENLAWQIREKIVAAYLVIDLRTSRTDKQFLAMDEKLATGLTLDLKMIREFFVRYYGGLPRELIQVVILLINLLILNAELTAFFILGILPFMALLNRYGKKIKIRTQQMLSNYSNLSEWIQQRLSGMETIKHYKTEVLEQDKMAKFNTQLMIAQNRGARAKSKTTPIVEFAAVVALSLVLYIAFKQMGKGTVSGAMIINFFTSIAFLGQSGAKLSRYFNINREAAAALARIKDIDDYSLHHQQQSVWQDFNFLPLKNPNDLISINNLNFAYQPNLPILKGLNLHIKKGVFYAICGKSGAGKSTLFNLLMGALPANREQVAWTKNLHRGQNLPYCFVPQKLQFVADKIWQNAVYPNEHYDSERLWQAFKLAGLDKVISSFSSKEEEQIGLIKNLSGGELQRLFLARMFYLGLAVNFVDEGTSSLDPEIERHIYKSMKDFVSSGKTIVMIAHRKAVLNWCDELIVLDQGKIIYQGSPRTYTLGSNEEYEIFSP